MEADPGEGQDRDLPGAEAAKQIEQDCAMR